MYETPRLERFGRLERLTMAKPQIGWDFATPQIPDDCTDPSEPGAENDAYCQSGDPRS
jgi:hypothetical protein